MKAVVLYGPGDVRMGELPRPTPGREDVCIKVAYCGICGSDFHKAAGKEYIHAVEYPFALGHEVSGVICEVGDLVTEFHVGDRVTVDPNWSCGTCYYCRAGKPTFCENAHSVVNGMAEYLVAPAKNIHPLPKKLSMRRAALAEPLSCCLRGIDQLDVQAGERVALIGFGAIGAIMLRLLRMTGAGEIVVIEYNPARREAALAGGADVFLCSQDAEEVTAYAAKYPIDRVIECVGIPLVQESALAVAGKGATVVMFGVPDSTKRTSVSFFDVFSKELTIKTSFLNPNTIGRALQLLAREDFGADEIIHTVISMDAAAKEFHTPNHTRGGKVLVEIDATLE